MSAYSLIRHTFVSVALASLGASATAQDNISGIPELRPSMIGYPLTGGKICPVGEFLSSISVRLTDRVTALWITCQRATFPDGLWSADAPHDYAVAGDTEKSVIPLSCPPNYFITGLAGLRGTYSEDSYGAAKLNYQLIADLRPVCRLQLGRPYILNRNYLDQAEDNNVKEIYWQNSNPQNCRPGYAAVGVGVDFATKRDWQMTSRFFDIAVYCRRLYVGPLPGLAKIPHL